MAPVPTTLPGLLAELEAEHDDLEGLLGPLDEASWGLATPAEGWAVRDQVSHLAYFDDAGRLAMAAPDEFSLLAEDALSLDGPRTVNSGQPDAALATASGGTQ